MRFRSGQDKKRARRGLLQSLQQGVEGLGSQHVNFVNDEDFVPVPRGKVAHGLAQLANLIDATVRSRVDLKDIYGIAGSDLPARRALTAGRYCWTLRAIQASSENPRRGGFANSAPAREDISMGHAIAKNGVLQSVRDQVLPHDLIKDLGSIFAGYDLIGHEGLDPEFWSG